MATISKNLLVLVILALLGCNAIPRPVIEKTDDGILVDIQTLGEYPTTLTHLRLTRMDTAEVVWEVRADHGLQLWTIPLRHGDNPSVPHTFGQRPIEVMTPETDSFALTPGEYELELSGEKRSRRRVRFQIGG